MTQPSQRPYRGVFPVESTVFKADLDPLVLRWGK